MTPWTIAPRFLCFPPFPRVCSSLCPWSQWWYLTISSSATPFCFCLQSFPASGSFPMSWIFTSGGQSIGVSASASFLPMNILELISFRIDWFDPLAVRDFQESSPAPWFESISSLVLCLLYGPTVIYMYMTTGKTIALTIGNFVGKVMSLLFNMLSRIVTVLSGTSFKFPPRPLTSCETLDKSRIWVCIFWAQHRAET